jgi:hypothetical protein
MKFCREAFLRAGWAAGCGIVAVAQLRPVRGAGEERMNKTIRWGLAAALAIGAAAANAGPTVSVSVEGEVSPGVYGRVDVSNAPPRHILYPQPVVIVQPERRARPRPIYMHVPPGHAKNWRKHCHKYDACGTPVYFVKSAEYEPGYHRHEHQGRDRDHARRDDRGHGHDRGHGRHD